VEATLDCKRHKRGSGEKSIFGGKRILVWNWKDSGRFPRFRLSRVCRIVEWFRGTFATPALREKQAGPAFIFLSRHGIRRWGRTFDVRLAKGI